MAKYYVYALIDPETGDKFYIGKGSGDRWKHHARDCQSGKEINRAKETVINRILSSGQNVGCEILARFDSQDDALAYEKRVIQSTSGLTNIVHASKVKSYSLYETINDVMNCRCSKEHALKVLRSFEIWAPEPYRRLIKATKKLANKNNWLTTECCHAE